MLILAIVILIISLLYVTSFGIRWLKNRTTVNGLIVWFFGCFAIGIMLDCIRVIVIFGLGGVFLNLDTVAHIGKVIAIFVSFTLVVEIHIVLGNYIDQPLKYQKFIRYYLVVLGFIFSALTIIFSKTTPPGEFGFYLFQVDMLFYVFAFIAYLPIALRIFFRKLSVLPAFENKAVFYKLGFFTLLTLFIIGERGYNLGGYLLVQSVLGIPIELSLLMDFIALLIISSMFLVTIIKFPDFMESVATYHSIKKLYVLNNNGLLIFEYNFENNTLEDGLSSHETLMGGFIYAITQTFKEILKTDEIIKSFSSGNRSVLIHSGEFLFGILVVTEDSSLSHRKLGDFITKYETYYRSDLENWTGEYSKFNRIKILEWIFETLREG